MEAGTRLGPYVILGSLGAGGMGEVYRAKDERLGREVAVKVLPERFAADPDRLRRFAHEARAASALNHPNILVVHDLGSQDGAPFLVTELLTGQTLRERLRAGDLPPRKALEVAAQVAAGLAAAHERGIVHRDLKPENLFLSQDGVAKILDFGLARSTSGDGAVTAAAADAETLKLADDGSAVAGHTEPGHVMGTPGYMAPEQVRGLPVDHRADIFALGCVLHEMIAGVPPFCRANRTDTLSAILTADPPPLSERGATLPPGIARTIMHCLEKRPEDRFQSARDLAFDLRAILADYDPASAGATAGTDRPPVDPATGPPATTTGPLARPRRRRSAPVVLALVTASLAVAAGWLWRDHASGRIAGLEPKRIVVMVLENGTGDLSLDPLGRMAADWITQGLLRIQGLDVVPSTSLLFTPPAGDPTVGADHDPWRQLVKETGAGTVISGSYYRQGETLRFQVRVTDAVDNKLILALDPVAGTVAEPMRAIDELRQRLMGAMAAREEAAHYLSARQEPPLYDAYREFIAGFELFMTDEPQALRHFQRSSELDSTFYAPLLYEAYLHNRAGDYPRAEEILRRLSDRREQLAPLTRYWLDALTAYVAHRYPEALQVLKDAQTLAPRDPLLNHWLGFMALCCNRPRVTVETYAQFGSRPWSGHPLGASWVDLLCNALHMLGEHRQELAEARRGLESLPDDVAISACEVAALAALGRVAELDKVIARIRAAALAGTKPGDMMLEAAMELRAHGHRPASLAYARQAAAWYRQLIPDAATERPLREGLLNALRWAEEWDEAAALCRAHLQESPEDLPTLGILGAIAARQGDREEAVRCSELLGGLTGPYRFGAAAYRQAGIAALLGDVPQAMDLLHRAIGEGVAYGLGHHRQIDFEPLWDEAAFGDLLRPRR